MPTKLLRIPTILVSTNLSSIYNWMHFAPEMIRIFFRHDIIASAIKAEMTTRYTVKRANSPIDKMHKRKRAIQDPKTYSMLR